MDLSSVYIVLVVYLSLVNDTQAVLQQKYTYIFDLTGHKEGGVIHTIEDGHIPMLTKTTKIPIPVPDGMEVTYVKVMVDAYTDPTVEYDPDFSRVTITYPLGFVTGATYQVLVKGKRIHAVSPPPSPNNYEDNQIDERTLKNNGY